MLKILGKLLAVAKKAYDPQYKGGLRFLFLEQGILFTMSSVDQFVPEKPSKGTEGMTCVTFRYAFIDAESGEKLDGSFVSQGFGKNAISDATQTMIDCVFRATLFP